MTATALEAPAEASYDLITSLEEVRERFDAIAAALLPFAIDVETGYHGETRVKAGLHAEENFVVSIQFTNSLAWGRMIPLAFENGDVNMDPRAVAALLWPLLHVVDGQGLPLAVAHGAVAELRWLARWFLRYLWNHPLYGRQVRDAHGYFPVRSCTMLESFAEGKNRSHALKASTLANFSHRMRELVEGPDSLLGRLLGKTPTKFEENSVRFNVFDPRDPAVIAYACEDVVWCLRHHLHRWERLRTGPQAFIYRLEMAVLPIVCDMSDVGVHYDWDLMARKAEEAHAFADRLLAEVIEDFEVIIGEKLPPSFNFNSNKQFGELLYVKCGMPVLHRTEKGAPSVDAKNALPGLAKEYPVVKKYMGWKRLTDLCIKFLDILEEKNCWAADRRAHPNLLQHGTIAGRFSCEDPNYQQSPGKYEYELRDGTLFVFNFRDVIIPAPPGWMPWWALVLAEAGCDDIPAPDPRGCYYLGFDYSQIELRVMAAESGETALLESFARGEDVHKRTAAMMYRIALSAVTDALRKRGKTRNFASIYGQGVRALAEQLGISLEEAQDLDRRYNQANPHMQPFRYRVINRAKRDGFIITKFGRRVTLHDIFSESRKVRAAEERTAGNAVIQGPATGEYVKMAMVRCVKALRKSGLADRGVRLIMNVHDALGFEVPLDIPPAEVIAVLQPAAVFPVTGPGVPWPEMVAEWHMGKSWGSVKDIHLEDGDVVFGKLDDCPRCRPEPEPEQEPAARKVLVVLTRNPAREQMKALSALMRELPGGNTVELRIPGGTFPAGFTCGLAPEHEEQVTAIFGPGSAVCYDLAGDLADAGV